MQARESSHARAIGPGVTGGPLAHPERTPHSGGQTEGAGVYCPSSGNQSFMVDPSGLSGHRTHTQYVFLLLII